MDIAVVPERAGSFGSTIAQEMRADPSTKLMCFERQKHQKETF